MRRHAILIVVGLAACSRSSEPPEVEQPSGPRDAPRGAQVKSYDQAVDKVELAQRATLENNLVEHIAFAPDGTRWAAVFGSELRFFEGDVVRATHALTHVGAAAGSIAFGRDGKSLWIGLREIDERGARVAHPDAPDLVAWLASAGERAPATLAIVHATRAADGALIVVDASGVTRDRRQGLRTPEGVDAEWLIALDGQTRAPIAKMWSGKEKHSLIAISDRHVAAGGFAGLRVFARDALTTPIELDPHAAMNLAWSPDGGLLAAGHGGRRKVSVWRAGAWDAPAMSWESGAKIIRALAFHPTRPVLLVGNEDQHVRLYDVSGAAPREVLDLDVGGAVHGAAWSPDGRTLLVSVGFPLDEIRRYDVTLAP